MIQLTTAEGPLFVRYDDIKGVGGLSTDETHSSRVYFGAHAVPVLEKAEDIRQLMLMDWAVTGSGKSLIKDVFAAKDLRPGT